MKLRHLLTRTASVRILAILVTTATAGIRTPARGLAAPLNLGVSTISGGATQPIPTNAWAGPSRLVSPDGDAGCTCPSLTSADLDRRDLNPSAFNAQPGQ